MSWQVKAERLEVDYDKETSLTALAKIVENVSNMSTDGWEPWHMASSVSGRIEYVTVWFKKESA